MVKINTQAPKFDLKSTNGEIYSLINSLSGYVVLYFYPKDDTPGCTIETNDFNKLLPKFKKLNCSIFGISKDDLKSHHKFKKKYKIKFELLSDVKLNILKKYKSKLKVLEVKNDLENFDKNEILNSINLKETRFSKYCNAVTMLYYESNEVPYEDIF